MNLKLCEIVQQVEYITLEQIQNGVENSRIRDYAYILHDKDVDKDGKLKKPHYHISLRLKDTCNTKHIAEWFSVKEQYICPVKGRWSDMLKYLTHENAEGKFQYDAENVVSNFDWVSVKNKSDKKKIIDDVLEKIERGEIREYNQFERIDIDVWARNKTVITNALQFYKERIFMNKDREINIIFCTGDTGTGKTTFAKEFCKKQNKSFCVSSSSNDVMQDYKGEDVLILDDLRDDTFKFTDLLKILDNHTKSSVQSRYSNKFFIGETIIITSFKDIINWYIGVDKESRVQLFRRVGLRFCFDNKYIKSYHWSDVDLKYIYDGTTKNTYCVKNDIASNKGIDMLKLLGNEIVEDEIVFGSNDIKIASIKDKQQAINLFDKEKHFQ